MIKHLPGDSIIWWCLYRTPCPFGSSLLITPMYFPICVIRRRSSPLALAFFLTHIAPSLSSPPTLVCPSATSFSPYMTACSTRARVSSATNEGVKRSSHVGGVKTARDSFIGNPGLPARHCVAARCGGRVTIHESWTSQELKSRFQYDRYCGACKEAWGGEFSKQAKVWVDLNGNALLSSSYMKVPLPCVWQHDNIYKPRACGFLETVAGPGLVGLLTSGDLSHEWLRFISYKKGIW